MLGHLVISVADHGKRCHADGADRPGPRDNRQRADEIITRRPPQRRRPGGDPRQHEHRRTPRRGQAVQPSLQRISIMSHRIGRPDLTKAVHAGRQRILTQVVEVAAKRRLQRDANDACQGFRVPGQVPAGSAAGPAGICADG